MKRLTWIRNLATSMMVMGVAGISAVELQADDTAASTVVGGIQISDGKEIVNFSFDEKPEVTFEDAEIIISTGDRKVAYPLTSSLIFTFVDNSGVEEICGEMVKFKITGNEIRATGLKSNERVLFFNTNGMLLHSISADSNGEFCLQTDMLPKQPVIVKTNKLAYKLILK